MKHGSRTLTVLPCLAVLRFSVLVSFELTFTSISLGSAVLDTLSSIIFGFGFVFGFFSPGYPER